MKRFFLLWLLLLAAGALTAGPLGFALRHEVNVRFEAFLILLLAPAVQAVLLFLFVPSLRDRGLPGPGRALLASRLTAAASAILLVICGTAILVVARALPAATFDVVRGALLLVAAAAFARAAMLGVRGAAGAAFLLAALGLTSGHLATFAGRIVFPSQPLAFRLLVFFAGATLVVVVGSLSFAALLRRSAPNAAALLEWMLAPAAIAGVIVLGNFYQRPYVAATPAFVANALGLAGAGLATLGGLAAARRS